MNDEGERKEPVGRCTAPSYRAEQDLYLKKEKPVQTDKGGSN